MIDARGVLYDKGRKGFEADVAESGSGEWRSINMDIAAAVKDLVVFAT